MQGDKTLQTLKEISLAYNHRHLFIIKLQLYCQSHWFHLLHYQE